MVNLITIKQTVIDPAELAMVEAAMSGDEPIIRITLKCDAEHYHDIYFQSIFDRERAISQLIKDWRESR